MGSGPTIHAPDPPDPQQVTREAIEAELELGPQLARQRMDLAEELSPRESELITGLMEEYGPALGEAIYAARAGMAPELTALEDETAAMIRERLGETDDEMLDAYRREFQATEAAAGRLGAPVGSVNLARQTVGARDALTQARISEALAATGKVPVTAAPQLGVTQPQTQSHFLGPIMGAETSIYGTQAGLASAQAQISQQHTGAMMGMIGTLGGGLFQSPYWGT